MTSVEAKRKVPGMANFLWIGSALGAALGLLHGIYLYRQQTARFGKRYYEQQSYGPLLWNLGSRSLDSLWGIRPRFLDCRFYRLFDCSIGSAGCTA